MSPKSQQSRTRLVLIDAHAVLHRAYHALPGFTTANGQPTGALYGLATMLVKLVSDLQPDYVAACYDVAQATHRDEVYEDYKAGRAETDQELVDQIKESERIFEAFSIPVYKSPGFEADDLLGTISAAYKERDDIEVIIASGDMDTMQLVDDDKVKVYTMKKGIQETVMYDKEAVRDRFGFGPEYLPDFKGLSGDSSDNIPGIKGIGEKTATTLIQRIGHIEDMYEMLEHNRDALTDAGIKERTIGLLEDGKDEAEFSKMLATIRYDAPVEFELPDTPWPERVDISEAQEIFQEYEFRNLDDRLADALGKEKAANAADTAGEELSDTDKAELPIMLWLLDSTMTTPSIKDVFQVTKTSSPDEARQVLRERLEKRGMLELFETIERPIIPVVREMTERGIKLDRAYLETLSKEYHEKLEEIEAAIYKEAGREFNINSPQQLAEVLFDELGLTPKNHKKTSTGQRSTAESELRKLEGEHPIIDHILEHRELAKLLGTYIDALPPLLDEKDRLHAEFLQAGTTTGRMASQNPNLQNIPIRSEDGRRIRNAFVATEGFQLAAFDYSQIELRVAAFLSGDSKLINTFKQGNDIHTAVAAEVFEVAPEEVDKEMRRKAKVINFGILYGMGVNALKDNLGTDRKEAQQFYNSYFEKFDELAAYIDRIKQETREKGYTETYFGRRRYFEGIDSPLPQVRASAERMAINAPVQGTAADILKIAMRDVEAWRREQGYEDKLFCLLQVHDELIYEIHNDIFEGAVERITELMQQVMSTDETSGVPLKVEAEAGPSWGEMRSIEDRSKQG